MWYDSSMIVLGLLFLFFVRAADAVRTPDVPETPGVYFLQGESAWIPLQPVVTSDANAKGLQLFVYTEGYTDLGLNVVCPGSRALIRILVPKPVLYVRAIGSAKDAMLIRLTKKRDQRVVKTSFSNVTMANKGGFRREDVFKLILQESPDGFFSVSPEKELPPGEYLLVLGNAVPAYDFGIDRKKE
jgi:hypothetical protein